MTPGSRLNPDQIQKLSMVQDIDLDPQAFAQMVKTSKLPAVVVLMTEGTYKSTPQLLRLGFLQQYNTAGFRPHPIAICDIFSMPDVKVVQDIQQGKVLALGSNYKAAVKDFLTEDVSFGRVALALIQVLESRVFLCNCPILTERTIKETLLPSLIMLAESISSAPKPVPEEDGLAKDVEVDMRAPTQQSRYMTKYISDEAAAPPGAAAVQEMNV
jgi:hypothetical protein